MEDRMATGKWFIDGKGSSSPRIDGGCCGGNPFHWAYGFGFVGDSPDIPSDRRADAPLGASVVSLLDPGHGGPDGGAVSKDGGWRRMWP